MALKSFKELYNLDIDPYISQKGNQKFSCDYVAWSDTLYLLYENGAEKVIYGNLYGPDGHSLFLSADKLPEVHVFVEIDGDRREITYPVIDGSRDVQMDKIAQSDVHNATQRAMVKCVATNWGLGLKLWQKQDREDLKKPQNDLSFHSLGAIQRRFNEEYTTLLQRGMTTEAITTALGVSEDEFKVYKTYFLTLDRTEKKMIQLIKETADSAAYDPKVHG
ncbi:MAG: DUF1071 domain-containing protein [Clostridiales bacterium]|nr:DUF1071 domain-containing protein [Clostridiales bacterium]